MANKVQKPCKICGKMFTPCADCENDKTMFRWKRVACSPECAKEYFRRIEESRKPKVTNMEPEVETTSEIISVDNNMNDTDKNVSEETKPKRTRKKNNVENIESEQID